MKPIVVKEQVRLSAGRCAQLAITGMGYRMFRSMITVAILGLAVAFLVHTLSHSLVASKVVRLAYDRLAGQRLLGSTVARLTQPDSQTTLMTNLARFAEPCEQEYRAWSAAGDSEMKQAVQDARLVMKVAAFIDDLPETKRVVLTGGRPSLEVVRSLVENDLYRLFEERLAQLHVAAPLEPPQSLRAVVKIHLPRLLALADRIAAGQAVAIERVKARYANRSALDLVAAPPADLASVMNAHGFRIAQEKIESISNLARADADREKLGRLLHPREVRNVIARETGALIATVNLALVLDHVTSLSRAQWLADTLAAKTGDPSFTAQSLLTLAQTYREVKNLEHALSMAEGPVEEQEGSILPLSVVWLVVLAFLVCAVGVANAMLMSVTERFSEIATMKCLGAMDGFVMMMFLFEAMLQGLFGGLAGMVLGLLLAFLRVWVEFGSLGFPAMGDLGAISVASLGSLLCGIILAAGAAVWPAWVAARLAPMEAMRVE